MEINYIDISCGGLFGGDGLLCLILINHFKSNLIIIFNYFDEFIFLMIIKTEYDNNITSLRGMIVTLVVGWRINIIINNLYSCIIMCFSKQIHNMKP